MSAPVPDSPGIRDSQLLLVYHANSGHLNARWDSAHKVISPDRDPCALCALIHGVLRERGAWKAFCDHHSGLLEIRHRDAFHRRYPDLTVPTPCVLARQNGGAWTVAMTAVAIQALPGVDALVERLDQIIKV